VNRTNSPPADQHLQAHLSDWPWGRCDGNSPLETTREPPPASALESPVITNSCWRPSHRHHHESQHYSALDDGRRRRRRSSHRRRSCLATEGCSPLAAACIVVSSAEPAALSTSMRASSYDDAHCGLRMGIRHVPWPSNHSSPLTGFARRPVNQSARLVRFSSYDPILVCLMPSGPWNPSPAAHGSPRVCVRSRRDSDSLLYL
jgi:hypothetical protein